MKILPVSNNYNYAKSRQVFGGLKEDYQKQLEIKEKVEQKTSGIREFGDVCLFACLPFLLFDDFDFTAKKMNKGDKIGLVFLGLALTAMIYENIKKYQYRKELKENK